jgi:hypothetical protein
MNCQVDDQRLSDYVDGALPAAETARLESHLAGCSRCRAIAADFGAIRSMAGSLDPLVPPPHVWRNVSAAARPPSRWSSLGSFFLAWQPAAATAMAAIITTGLWWVGDRLSIAAPPSSPRAEAAASTEARAGGSGHLAEVSYVRAIASLEELTGAERAALDPDMIDALDNGMTIIDAAIDQSRAALQTEPDSEVAQGSLIQALRSKVSLLQETLTLVNEMRKDTQSGTTRIAERTP